MGPEDFGTVYDPVETLSYVAARTSRIALGTSVLDALFQSPIILARRLATLDRFSEGRLIVGVGQGWMEQEFEAAGVSMKRRGAGFEEHLLAMRAVWGPDPVRFEGRFYRIPEADIGPKPVRPRGPTPDRGRRLTLGARARRTARSRADLGDLRLGREPREYRDLSSGGRRRRRRPRHAAGHASGEWQPDRRAAGSARTAGRFA
jgi:alkanesulfonate monooxygenase SsuD/methylene tetrahydromethanopterin reductase-like flavin-dependent oxidoreductase (luciferase family)